MLKWTEKRKIRRRQVREQRARSTVKLRSRLWAYVSSWPVLIGAVFCAGASATALWGEAGAGRSIGERIDQPIYARVAFQVPDAQRTAADKEAARASTPSYYTWNNRALTFGKIRTDLLRLYDAAAAAPTFEEYEQALAELTWPAEAAAYRGFRALIELPDDRGRAQFQQWVDNLPLEDEYVVRGLAQEARDPKSATEYIVLETIGSDEQLLTSKIPHAPYLVTQGNVKALRGSASAAARKIPSYELRTTIEEIIFATFSQQPTIVYQQERTVEEMRKAEKAVPPATTTYEKGKPFIHPGELGREDSALLDAHHAAYLAFLHSDDPEAHKLRRERLLHQVGLCTLVTLLSIGLLVYTGLNRPRIFEIRARSIAFTGLVLGTLFAARVLHVAWGQYPELILAPCLICGIILAIVYPRPFALGATCIVVVLVATMVRGTLAFVLMLLTGAAVAVYQLDEIRSRTKLIASGALTAVATVVASAAGGLYHRHSGAFVIDHASWAGASALMAAFVVSGILPFIERLFRIATSLTFLEWRDPTRPLLQLLAREAPGTYNHSLVIGTLAQAACEKIGANGLLAQVGALYHDIGKIPKAEYFAENQIGQINRHDNLAPTMSLLIILGHVKDGMEMAKEYKLPRLLHQFIEEHHGTTVVRYFHHVASEKQPQIARGKHDREVPEAEFRYSGPKPRGRESAVIMLCDGVEGAVRALQEPTVGRIENVVHHIVTDRLNDGQFDDCDITLRDVRLVEDSLVKSLCSIYHGRVTYPKSAKTQNAHAERARASG